MRQLVLTFLFCLIAYSAQAQFACDVFTDTVATALTSHSSVNGGLCGVSGSSWTSGEGTNLIINASNKVSNNAATATNIAQSYFISATPPSADYSVALKVQHSLNGSSSHHGGPLCRKQSGANTYYVCELFGGGAGTRGLRYRECTAGTCGAATTYTFDWAVDTEYGVKIECVGSAIKCFLDEELDGTYVERVSVTDTSITTAGNAGIRFNDASTAIGQGDDFIATDLGTSVRRRMSFMGD